MKDIETINKLYGLLEHNRDKKYNEIVKLARDAKLIDENESEAFIKYHYYKFRSHNGLMTPHKNSKDKERYEFSTYMNDHKDYKILMPIERKRIISEFIATHPNISKATCSSWVHAIFK